MKITLNESHKVLEKLLLELNGHWNDEVLHKAFWDTMYECQKTFPTDNRTEYLLTYLKLGKLKDREYLTKPQNRL